VYAWYRGKVPRFGDHCPPWESARALPQREDHHARQSIIDLKLHDCLWFSSTTHHDIPLMCLQSACNRPVCLLVVALAALLVATSAQTALSQEAPVAGPLCACTTPSSQACQDAVKVSDCTVATCGTGGCPSEALASQGCPSFCSRKEGYFRGMLATACTRVEAVLCVLLGMGSRGMPPPVADTFMMFSSAWRHDVTWLCMRWLCHMQARCDKPEDPALKDACTQMTSFALNGAAKPAQGLTKYLQQNCNLQPPAKASACACVAGADTPDCVNAGWFACINGNSLCPGMMLGQKAAPEAVTRLANYIGDKCPDLGVNNVEMNFTGGWGGCPEGSMHAGGCMSARLCASHCLRHQYCWYAVRLLGRPLHALVRLTISSAAHSRA
jgi:hypothetical protein